MLTVCRYIQLSVHFCSSVVLIHHTCISQYDNPGINISHSGSSMVLGMCFINLLRLCWWWWAGVRTEQHRRAAVLSAGETVEEEVRGFPCQRWGHHQQRLRPAAGKQPFSTTSYPSQFIFSGLTYVSMNLKTTTS